MAHKLAIVLTRRQQTDWLPATPPLLGGGTAVVCTAAADQVLELTEENVELVLDEVGGWVGGGGGAAARSGGGRRASGGHPLDLLHSPACCAPSVAGWLAGWLAG